MERRKPAYYRDMDKCVDDIIEQVGRRIVFGMPLALGKPNQLVNALYARAKQDPRIHLTIMTALSLEIPVASSELERRFLDPMVKRIWKGFVPFDYLADMRSGNLPPNVDVKEFFTKAGGYLDVPHAQQNYISSNYTHAVRDLMDNGLNVIGNIVAKRQLGSHILYSTSCNPDLVLEAMARSARERKNGRTMLIVGQVNTHLPFMYGDAVVEPAAYDMIIDNIDYDFELFCAPKAAVATADYMVGLHVSTLIKDGGTLQIGIGSLGDAIASGLILRHRQNDVYTSLVQDLEIDGRYGNLIGRLGGTGIFHEGLYGATEMLVDVFMELYKNDVIRRKVYDHKGIQALLNAGRIHEKIGPETLFALEEIGAVGPEITRPQFESLQRFGVFKDSLCWAEGRIRNGVATYSPNLADPDAKARLVENCLGEKLENGVLCHGAFFIGPKSFYNTLNEMSEAERRRFSMTGVDKVNQLYGDESLRRLQRKDGRFVNAGMMVTLLGGVVSDGLENGNIVSGVGGQYNFVSMAHALEDGRLIMMIRATRRKGCRVLSNIVFSYGHITIPRHLRDMVVTEYGIADLRGKTDREVVCALLNIADSRFQEELLARAKAAGKVPGNYRIPEPFRQNLPERLEAKLEPYRRQGLFPAFPFGTDFTEEEIVIGGALKRLKGKITGNKFMVLPGLLRNLVMRTPESQRPYLARMGLDRPGSLRERLMQAAVSYALES